MRLFGAVLSFLFWEPACASCLSKFQDVLPAAMAVETIENYLLDVKTTRNSL